MRRIPLRRSSRPAAVSKAVSAALDAEYAAMPAVGCSATTALRFRTNGLLPALPDASRCGSAARTMRIGAMVLMAKTLADQRLPVRMLLGARNPQELAFGEDLRRVLGDRLLTASASLGQSLDWASEIKALPPGGQAYVCGPVPMLDAVRKAQKLGLISMVSEGRNDV